MTTEQTKQRTVSIAMTGSGGSGVMTAGQMLLDAAAKAGYYGMMTRSSGPQIRGGEAAAFVRISRDPITAPNDVFDLMIAFDWMNVERFRAEIPLDGHSLILGDPAAGAMPDSYASSGAQSGDIALKAISKSIEGGRPNMVALGAVMTLIGLDEGAVTAVVEGALAKKGEAALVASREGIAQGMAAAKELGQTFPLEPVEGEAPPRWNISGNEATGLGAVKGGCRFVAAYPITPATEVLEWLAPNIEKLGGTLVQAEDELASVNMAIGGSFGGKPSLTATAGPGLALMMESIGLAVASETPIVVVDVMRGGPSTGIPVKSEQSDLNIACYGLHGDAPHVVTAANSIGDCVFTAQWSMYLAEAMQTAVIMLTDQTLGQSRAVVDKPADLGFVGQRAVAEAGVENYLRYANTASGVSPMAIPGTPGGEYVADGLEHQENARPSSDAEVHQEQLDKRERKITGFDYVSHWAISEGDEDAETVIVTWGSSTGTCAEALRRAEAEGIKAKLLSLRLLMPAQTEKFAEEIKNAKRVLVVEQTHSKQFYHYLRAHFDLPAEVKVFAQPGPLPIRPAQVVDQLQNWS